MDVEAFRERSRQSWDAVSGGWEARRDFLERNMGVIDDWIVERVAPTTKQIVLDVGAGAGHLGHRVARELGDGGRVLSTDFSPDMVEVARRVGAEHGLTNVDYRVLDAERMDLDDASVDAIVCRACYMLVADPAAALSEAARVLRPGGSLGFSVFTAPDRNPWAAVPGAVLVELGHLEPPRPGAPGVFALSDPDRLRELLENAGFADSVIEPVDLAFHYDDADDAWGAVVDLNAPLSIALEGMSEDQVDAARSHVVDRLAPYRAPDGSYPVPAQAWAVHATAPTEP